MVRGLMDRTTLYHNGRGSYKLKRFEDHCFLGGVHRTDKYRLALEGFTRVVWLERLEYTGNLTSNLENRVLRTYSPMLLPHVHLCLSVLYNVIQYDHSV